MTPHRRAMIAGSFSATVLAGPARANPEKRPMYGLIGKMTAQQGQRDALIAAMSGGIQGMPGCLSYVVSKDAREPDALWITEVWDSEDSHQASLKLPAVQASIAKGRPLILDMGPFFVTQPVAGVGL